MDHVNRPRAALALVVASTVLGLMGTDLVLPAVPSLPETLGGGPAESTARPRSLRGRHRRRSPGLRRTRRSVRNAYPPNCFAAPDSDRFVRLCDGADDLELDRAARISEGQ